MIIRWKSPLYLFKSMYHAALFVLDGRKIIAPVSIQKYRLKKCLECEHHDLYAGQCNLCACFTFVKVKLSSSSCPDNPQKWDALTSSHEPDLDSP